MTQARRTPDERPDARPEAVVLGGSAGAVDALQTILSGLPPRTPFPLACVVHLRRDRPSLLADVLAPHCALPTREAMDKEPLESGTVYFAPPGYHLLMDEGPAFALSVEEPVRFSIPSIDVLFESAAAIFGAGLVGIVLTGASDDGAAGAAAIAQAGGRVVVQSPDEAAASVMPRAALRRCPDARVLTLEELRSFLTALAAGPHAL